MIHDLLMIALGVGIGVVATLVVEWVWLSGWFRGGKSA